MKKVEEIKVITIDEVPYAVDQMSETVQQLVDVYNDWNQKEMEARSHLMMISAAKNDLSRQIVQQVRADKEAAEAAKADNTTEAKE